MVKRGYTWLYRSQNTLKSLSLSKGQPPGLLRLISSSLVGGSSTCRYVTIDCDMGMMLPYTEVHLRQSLGSISSHW